MEIDYSNIIYSAPDPTTGQPVDIDGCTLFVYGSAPTPAVNVLTGSWQPDPAAAGQPITSAVTTRVDNPYQSPSGDSISQHWSWDTTGVYLSADGTSGSFTPDEGDWTISWDEGAPTTTFTGTFNDPGYYIISVTATLTYHDDTTNTDVGTYTETGYIGGSATDLAPPPAGSAPQAMSAHQVMRPMDASNSTAGKGLKVTASGITVWFGSGLV